MATVDIPRVRGRMAEKGYSITSLSGILKISRNTLSAYFDHPQKMPYDVVSELAAVLCDTPGEAKSIFLQGTYAISKNGRSGTQGRSFREVCAAVGVPYE